MDKKSSKTNNMTDTMRKKQALVTITPYNEQEKRILNETSTTMTATTTMTTTSTTTTTTTTMMGPAMPPPAPPPLPLPSKNRGNDDLVEMQSIESFKLKETPNTVPKPPPTYFPVTSPALNGSPRHIGTGSKVPKDAATSPVTELAKTSLTSVSPTNGAQVSKSLAGSKVAVRIGAYEGETKQPSRLEFLPQQSSRDCRNGDEAANSPVVSRLQNELAATLQRSNLRRKTEGEKQSPVKTISENATTSSNDTTNSEPNKLLQSNVEKLASVLSNKVTIRVNPENNSR